MRVLSAISVVRVYACLLLLLLCGPRDGYRVMTENFGHYRLDVQIGQGGMAEVFRAFDTRLKRPVAVKRMRKTLLDQPTSVQRFLREARAASALNHPNIVIIHEVGETAAGEPYIVQEFIDGRTLRSILTEPLPVATVADIGSQVARALAAAHANGIVHRDVKPENIMVRGDGFVKVLDFGIARKVEVDATDANTKTQFETVAGMMLGTPSYMSPEQVLGHTAQAPTDVFALGIVLYEMTSGRRPFVAATHVGVLASIVSDQAPSLAHVAPGAPQALDHLVQRMLEKDPGRRPSARDVERELAGVAQSAVSVSAITPPRARATVGREAERAQLLRVYARVKGGQSVILAVTGEPGIGKTSLIEDFLHDLSARGERATVARGRCSETLAGSEAYLPILEVLDSLLHRSTGAALDATIKTVAPTWYVQVATRTTEETSAGQLRETTPAASQERMKRELGHLLQELSRVQPLVLFIDDLHWADVSTIDILNYLAGRFSDMRVLVLVSYRPSDLALAKHPFLNIRHDLQSRGLFEEVGISFLTAGDVERYLALQFPRHAFAPEFVTAIHTKTEGSPLFMADLVRYLRDTGSIAEERGTWVVARSISNAPRDLPESVRGMITRKIERVDERDRRLLVAASVQGHEFDSAIIAEASDLDAAEVEDRLDALERVHVFVRRGDELEFPDGTLTLKYQFVHVLYQNVLYASLQPTRRVTLSGKIARALTARHATEMPAAAGRLALLYETARDFASSARFFLIAANRAVSLFAFREALTLAERGLDGLKSLPDAPERQQVELALQMTRGLALRSVKGWAAPELETAFARARELCQQLENPPELFPVLWNLAFFAMIRGELATVREQIVTLRAQAEQTRNDAYLMSVNHIDGVSLEFIGDIVESSRRLEGARELHDPDRHQSYTAMFGIDPGMVARAMSSRPLFSLGYPDRALARSRETIALGRSQRQPVTLVFALIVAQGIHLYRGEADEAIALGDEIIALCREYEFPQEAEWARAFQGSALARKGRSAEAVAQLQDSLAAMKALRSGLVRTHFLGLLGDALLRAGRVDNGLQAIDEGFAHAERTSERGFVAELHRLRGELLLMQGDQAAAEESLNAALAYAREQHAKAFELRAATALARLQSKRAHAGDAWATLAAVYGWFSEGHDTADVVAARSLLNTIGQTSP
jgi:predicted ATPase/tRNA A-37 threonylcarbamoyl transferase component Bud32